MTADKAVSIIEEKAKTGNIGNGKIFVYSVDNIIRIRTGESGETAIYPIRRKAPPFF